MKKIIAFVLCFTLVFSMLSVAASATDGIELKFAVASDLHYVTSEGELEWFTDDPVYGYANRRASMDDESSYIIDSMLRQCAEDDNVEFLLIPGDLTDSGRRYISEHHIMAEKLAKFEEESGKPVFVIGGNHDFGRVDEYCETGVEEFIEVYNEFGYSDAVDTLEGTCSYTADLNENYRLIAYDSCDVTASTADGVDWDGINWVLDMAAKAKSDGKHPILMMHHNLLDHLPMQRLLSRNFIIKFHSTIAELFADAGIKLVFTGHEHASDVADYTSGNGNTIYDFATTALTQYPLEYRYIEISPEEIKYQKKVVDSIDTDALRQNVKGYTDEIINAMNEDFPSFANNFSKAGIEYRLALSLTEEKLGVSPDQFYYGIVMTAVTGLTDILEMPLCGENSMQELALDYGIEIPDSEYENGWDLVTDLVNAHYAGNEAFTPESAEVVTFWRTVALILRTDLAGISDEIFFKGLNKLLADYGIESVSDEITKWACKTFGYVTPVEEFIATILYPIVNAAACDWDGVDDNNGIIEGYGEAPEPTNDYTDDTLTTVFNVIERLVDIVKAFIRIYNLVLSYI